MALLLTLTISYFISSKSITTKNTGGHIQCGGNFEGPWTAQAAATETWSIQLDSMYTGISIAADCTVTNLRSSLRLLNANEVELFSEDCMPQNPAGGCRCQAGGYDTLAFTGFISAGIYYFEITFIGGEYDYKYIVTCTGAQTSTPTSTSVTTVTNSTAYPTTYPTQIPTLLPTISPSVQSTPETLTSSNPTISPSLLPTNVTHQDELIATEMSLGNSKDSTITVLLVVGVCIAVVVCIFCFVLMYKIRNNKSNGTKAKFSISISPGSPSSMPHRLNSASPVPNDSTLTNTNTNTNTMIKMTSISASETTKDSKQLNEQINEIEQWLRGIGLSESANKYCTLFMDGGYESMDIVKKCVEENQHLVEIGITTAVHQRLILKEINELKQMEFGIISTEGDNETFVTEGNDTQYDPNENMNNPNITANDVIL